MADVPGMLIAWDAEGNIIAGQMFLKVRDPVTGKGIGFVNYCSTEEDGLKFRHIPGERPGVWNVQGAAGSGAWPEYLGSRATEFKVELDAGNRAVALVHKKSGHRRDRADVDMKIKRRIKDKQDEAKREGRIPDPVDLRDLVGGFSVPLVLDEDGR